MRYECVTSAALHELENKLMPLYLMALYHKIQWLSITNSNGSLSHNLMALDQMAVYHKSNGSQNPDEGRTFTGGSHGMGSLGRRFILTKEGAPPPPPTNKSYDFSVNATQSPG